MLFINAKRVKQKLLLGGGLFKMTRGLNVLLGIYAFTKSTRIAPNFKLVWPMRLYRFLNAKFSQNTFNTSDKNSNPGLNQTDRPLSKLHCGRDTKGHSLKLAKHRYSKEVRRVSFTQRVVTTWNELPEHVVRAPTVNAFKNRFDKHWENHPSVFDADCYW